MEPGKSHAQHRQADCGYYERGVARELLITQAGEGVGLTGGLTNFWRKLAGQMYVHVNGP